MTEPSAGTIGRLSAAGRAVDRAARTVRAMRLPPGSIAFVGFSPSPSDVARFRGEFVALGAAARAFEPDPIFSQTLQPSDQETPR